MRQQSWVVAYIDSSRAVPVPAGWPHALRRVPELFNVLRHPNETVAVWRLPDLAADQLADELRDQVEVVMVVAVPALFDPQAPVVKRGRDAYKFLEDNWRYQLQYLDPRTESRLGAEWGLAEGTYETEAGPISLLEHRYILEGLSNLAIELGPTLKARRWQTDADSFYRPQRVSSAALDRLVHADEPQLRSVLRRQIHRQDLGYAELLSLPGFLTIDLYERLATIVRQNREARSNEAIVRRALDVLSTLNEEALKTTVAAFQAVATSSLVATLAAGLANEPELRSTVKLAGYGYASQLDLRRLDEQRRRRFARYVTVARLLARLDWSLFLEEVDPAYGELRADPGRIFSHMTSESRQRYRREVAQLAEWAKLPDVKVAKTVNAVSAGTNNGEALFGDLRSVVEQQLGTRIPVRVWIARFITRYPTAIYYLFLVVGWLLVGALVWESLSEMGTWLGVKVVLVLLAFQPVAELTNYYVTRLLPPRFLPELDVENGGGVRTPPVIAVPTMLSGHIDEDIRRLELRFLANRLPGAAYGLLTDWTDAPTETTPADIKLLTTAENGIAALQQRYPEARFFLYHRPRSYAKSEQAWIGHERKRGKLEDFVSYLHTGTNADWLRVGSKQWLSGAKYLITLDADTTLPPGTASRLFGAAGHPLNQQFGFIQPHVATGYESATANGFSRLYHHQPGVDPYLRSFSDAYFDLSSEAIFHGKGIMNVARVYELLHHHLPDEQILSHDLLEGSYVGVGLASDIVLYDDFPASLSGVMARDQRWTRGDWQLIAWLGRMVPRLGGREHNPLSSLNRYKIADNLRRSLIDPGTVVALIAASAWGKLMPVSLIIICVRFLPAVITAPHGRDFFRSMWLTASIRGYELSVLPYRALRLMDAIIRAMWRSGVSRRHLLQWRTAAEAANQAQTGLDRWFVGQLAVMALVIGLSRNMTGLVWLLLWAGGVIWTYRLERPRVRPQVNLSDDDRSYLRRLALQIWQYFDDFMTSRNNFLPPDNYQVAFKNETAPRTSPTNIGLGLMAWIEGLEFGFTTFGTALERITASLEVITGLERYRGHLFNWYDVTTGLPVGQRFVSTVDSGNFVMSLWSLRGGLEHMQERPLAGYEQAEALRDLLNEMASAAPQLPAELLSELSGAIDASLAEPSAIKYVTQLSAVCRLIAARKPTLMEVCGRDNQPLKRLLQVANTLEVHLGTYLGWFMQIDEFSTVIYGQNSRLASVMAAPVSAIPSLNDLTGNAWREHLAELARFVEPATAVATVVESFHGSRSRAIKACAAIVRTSEVANQLAEATDFSFLYNRQRRTFHIGYDVDAGALNRSYYDLLASEARTASFVAVATGQVPARHWWALGRNTRILGGRAALLSWSGTMFEYLMPRLFLRNYPSTLLDQALTEAVAAQRAQAKVLGVPWGISESGHSDLDADDTYQYHAYGVQGLAVQAVPEQGTVVAPYASCLALMVDPQSAIANLQELERLGVRGRYGFYEAADYRRPYRPSGERGLIVYSYMAHHLGMSLLALSNTLHDDIVVRRVERDARVAAASPLLQERPPKVVRPTTPTLLPAIRPLKPIEPLVVADGPSDLARPIPPLHVFSNGRLTSSVTARGTGSLHWRSYELGRLQVDPLLEQGGLRLYLSDESGQSWPLADTASPSFRVESLPEALSFESTQNGLRSRLELMVAPEADVEIRYLRLFDTTATSHNVALTSLFEFGLAAHDAQQAHPAFNQLFIATEALPEFDGVLAMRRHRSDQEEPLYVAHVVVNLSEPSRRAELGNDRTDFIGRVGSLAKPAGLARPLSIGPSLDPAAIVRQHVRVAAGGEVELAILTLVADSRAAVLALAERYRQARQIRRVRQAAWAAAESELQRLQTSHAETELFQLLGGYLTYPNAYLKLAASSLVPAAHPIDPVMPSQQPIIVAVSDETDLGLVRQLWLASAYLNRRGHHLGLLVIARSGGESQTSFWPALEAVRGGMESLLGNELPICEVVLGQQLGATELAAAIAGARIVLDAKAGSLSDQLAEVPRLGVPRSLKVPAQTPLVASLPAELPLSLGGFNDGGRTYAFDLQGATTPAPWSNVIANSVFGTLVTERGSGFTWDGNSQQNRLSPWRNDGADDRPSEGWYLWEDATSEFWPILPAPSEQPQLHTEHCIGSSRWSGSRSELGFSVRVTVPQGSTKPRRTRLSEVVLTNTSNRTRKLVLSHFTELSLGRNLEADWTPVRSIWRMKPGVLLFRSPSSSLRDAVIYASLNRPILDLTTSRAEATGAVADGLPYGLAESQLSGRVGRSYRPVAVLRTIIELEPGQSVSTTSFLGAANNESEAIKDAAVWQTANIDAVFESAAAVWEELTGAITVRTPEPELNTMLNHWLIYQVISSRLWGRTGYYQSSGAFGFRDQLQDVMALVYAQPDLARMQILTAANHQFIEGDAQHWWQPLTMWGLRSQISDDRLWLPYVVAHYLTITGDTGILDVEVAYIEGPALSVGQSEAYYEATVSNVHGTILDHCLRAMSASTTRGVHGLPLMGSGDWCDGYNRVGINGQGETVWGAWFLAVVKDELATILDLAQRPSEATVQRAEANTLRQAATDSWDGAWYRRGYYDDGTPLGSATSDEGKIDSLPQSWAVLAGLSSSRERQAIQSAIDRLVDDDAGVVRLLAPSFDKTRHDPGYIRGYLPGVRENGGQYTHGSIWLAIAAARLGQPAQAHHLLELMMPTWHGATAERQARYHIEPYVMAGDVYAHPGLEGRGGWSWYSGSAAWMYRAWIEEILGLEICGNKLTLKPGIPAKWPSFELTYRYRSTVYELTVHNSRSLTSTNYQLDGLSVENSVVTMVDDGGTHTFELWLG